MQREKFGSRIGFILVSAGCAVGLGNVWRFPYVAGEYGGAAFVMLYLFFLVILALPALVIEFACGRASQRGIARSFEALEPAGTRWHMYKWVALAGNYLLMMFYTVVAGWMLCYAVASAQGAFVDADTLQVAAAFDAMLADPVKLGCYTLAVIAVGLIATRAGLQKGVERVSKVIMSALFVALLVLCVRSLTLEGAAEGLAFYLVPDFGKLFAEGWGTFFDAVYTAMGQAFFTVSVGMGSMLIFGSYLGKERSLPGEAMRVAGIDTGVAFLAGLIVFPACFAFGVEPGSGPRLVFVTLPHVFAQMPLGQLWCTLFFVFMSFAAISTVIAVFENIMGFSMDEWGLSRGRATLVNGVLLAVLALPCVLGTNLLAHVAVPGIGDIQAIEDFIVSNNILPIGALVLVLFCTRRRGWGWEGFFKEANAGTGAKLPAWTRVYISYVLPLMILAIFVMGWLPILQGWLGLA